jgi:endosialidase-like protein
MGRDALFSNTIGTDNAAMGYAALSSNIGGFDNTAMGSGALFNSIGDGNTAMGAFTLGANTNGSYNIALGANAGSNPIASSYSIFIGNIGLPGDSNVTRIGTEGTQLRAFVAGISNVMTGAPAIPVLVDSTGQLGTISSSRRYKYDINSRSDVTTMLQKLRPVTFRYKQAQNDGQHPIQYGLIAEEVAEVFPDLAVFNKDGTTETVNYHLLPSFLLAGYQSQQQTIAAQAEKIDAQDERIATLEQRLRAIEAMLPKVTTTAAVQ